MAFRNNNRSFERNNYGGGSDNRNNASPWGDNQMNSSNNRGGNMMNQNGQGGGHLNSDALSLANSLISNLLRNQGSSVPPSLMDLPPSEMRRFAGGYGNGPNRRYDDFKRFDDRNGGRMGGGIGNRKSGPNNNRNNRRQGPGGANRSNQKGGIRKAKDRTKNVLAKNANATDIKVETSGEVKENGGAGQRRLKRRESPYANVPNEMFYCHMCKKHMWDSTSFENHIKGRIHRLMREGIEESYRLRANMIRQEAKIQEQLKSIESGRMKRSKGPNQHSEYCKMCDLQFCGRLSIHRKSDGHLNLKKFLHPKCIDCNKEFTNRTDFDEHLLSPTHMLKAAGKVNRYERKRNKLNILTEVDELPGLKEEKEEKDEKDEEKKEEATVDENGVAIEKMEAVEGEEKPADGTEPVVEEVKVVEESADIILDFSEQTEIPIEIEDKIPKYNCTRPLGFSMISKLECFECRICERFFDTESTAEIHSRTIYHHRQYIKMLNEKANETKIAQKRAEARAEEIERKKKIQLEEEAEAAKLAENGGEAALYDPSEATIDEDDTTVVKTESVDNTLVDESFVSTTDEPQDTSVVEDVTMEEIPAVVVPVVVETPATPIVTPSTPTATTITPAATPVTPKQTPPQRGGAGRGRGRGRGRYGGKY